MNHHSIVLAFCPNVIRIFLKPTTYQSNYRTIYLAVGLLILLLCLLFLVPFASFSIQKVYAQTITPIYAIQGEDTSSPFHNQQVNTYGVVTGVTANGFYLQDPVGDGNEQTSDGLFVYTYHPPEVQVGQCASIRGARVIEFYGKTELTRAGFIEPTTRCSMTTITPAQIPTAQFAQEPAELFEQYEGMLVTMDALSGVVQGPTKRFKNGEAEIALIPPELNQYLPGGRLFRREPEQNTALIYLSNALGIELPDTRWGDRIFVTASLDHGWEMVAILDYNFGKYQLLPLPSHEIEVMTGTPSLTSGLPQTDKLDRDTFAICTFNAFGLGQGTAQFPEPVAYEAQLYKRALAIAIELNTCTIIALQETGTPQDAENLADILHASFNLDYVATAISGPGSNNTEFPLTNSFLTQRDRVQINHIALHQGCSDIDYEVIDETTACIGQYPLFNRPPLLLDVIVNGNWTTPYQLTLINNHWKSKSGDESVNVVRRQAQAQHVGALVQERLHQSPDAHVVVLGDLNDFYDSDPVATIRTVPEPDLISLHDFLPEMDRYTYIFNGASQVLDHILITPKMRPQFASLHLIRISADFPYPTTVDKETVYHASDHDPLITKIRPVGAAILGGNLKFAEIHVQLFSEDEDGAGLLIAETTTDALGDFRFWDLTPGTYTIRYHAPPFIDLKGTESTISLNVGYNTIEATDIAHDAIMVATGMATLSPEMALSIGKPIEERIENSP